MLDPRTGDVLSPAAVLIENGKIKEVGSPTQVQAHGPGVKTIDLGSSTLLPGLIDSHTHLLLATLAIGEHNIEFALFSLNLCNGTIQVAKIRHIPLYACYISSKDGALGANHDSTAAGSAKEQSQYRWHWDHPAI